MQINSRDRASEGPPEARVAARERALLARVSALDLPRIALLVLVFIAGMVTLGLEISGPRLMAPYFGTTVLIWAVQIGFTLIYLALGYFLGGRFADRHPSATVLCGVTAIAAVSAAIIPFVSQPILEWSVSTFQTYDIGIFVASLLGVLLLFSVPITLLGMVAPFAVRLSVRQVGTSGTSAGTLYALSTVGSIIGAFLPVLVLIPAWGVRRTILAGAFVLLLASLWGLAPLWRRLSLLPSGLLLIPLLLPNLLGPLKTVPNMIFEQESLYNYIQVTRDADGTTNLILNEGAGSVHSKYNPNKVLLGCPNGECWYADYLLAAPYFSPGFEQQQLKSMAIIGLAGGTIARQYTSVYGPIRIDGAELDPAIVAVGKKYFGLTEKNLHVYYGDGRTFLRTTRTTYDVISVDAFQQPYMPFQLTTLEFYRSLRAHLAPGGVVTITSGHCGSDYRLVQVLVNTLYASGFGSVFTMDIPGSLNTEIVATNRASSVETLRANLAPLPAESLLGTVAARVLPVVQAAQAQPNGLVFTDDRAPVEQITDQLILSCISQK